MYFWVHYIIFYILYYALNLKDIIVYKNINIELEITLLLKQKQNLIREGEK